QQAAIDIAGRAKLDADDNSLHDPPVFSDQQPLITPPPTAEFRRVRTSDDLFTPQETAPVPEATETAHNDLNPDQLLAPVEPLPAVTRPRTQLPQNADHVPLPWKPSTPLTKSTPAFEQTFTFSEPASEPIEDQSGEAISVNDTLSNSSLQNETGEATSLPTLSFDPSPAGTLPSADSAATPEIDQLPESPFPAETSDDSHSGSRQSSVEPPYPPPITSTTQPDPAQQPTMATAAGDSRPSPSAVLPMNTVTGRIGQHSAASEDSIPSQSLQSSPDWGYVMQPQAAFSSRYSPTEEMPDQLQFGDIHVRRAPDQQSRLKQAGSYLRNHPWVPDVDMPSWALNIPDSRPATALRSAADSKVVHRLRSSFRMAGRPGTIQ
ncbi:MAG: hypothetical protein KDA85_02855, partial [Planctomycetaceae bacterium]|nr:hypothetical protein [Planctomycetaceae bacterium]